MNPNEKDLNNLNNGHHSCECGCNCDFHDHELDDDLEEMESIVLTLNDGRVIDCAVLGIFDSGEEEYIALVDTSSDEEMVLIYRYIEDENLEEGFKLENIEEDEEYNKVIDTFSEIFIDEVEE